MTDSSDQVLEILNEKKTMTKYTKSNRWWDETLGKLHKLKCKALKEHREAGYKDPEKMAIFKHWKQVFKKKVKENKELNNDKLANKLKKWYETDKTKFWNILKRNKIENKPINANLEDVEKEYNDLF